QSTFGGRAVGAQDKSTNQHLLVVRRNSTVAPGTRRHGGLILKTPNGGWGVPLFFRKSWRDTDHDAPQDISVDHFAGGRNSNMVAGSNSPDTSPVSVKLSTTVSLRTGWPASKLILSRSIQKTCGL